MKIATLQCVRPALFFKIAIKSVCIVAFFFSLQLSPIITPFGGLVAVAREALGKGGERPVWAVLRACGAFEAVDLKHRQFGRISEVFTRISGRTYFEAV